MITDRIGLHGPITTKGNHYMGCIRAVSMLINLWHDDHLELRQEQLFKKWITWDDWVQQVGTDKKTSHTCKPQRQFASCEMNVCEKFCDKICPGNSRAFPRFFWEVTHTEGFVAKPWLSDILLCVYRP